MAALPSLTLIFLFASTLLLLPLPLLSLYIKRRRRRGHHPTGEQAADEPQRHQDIPEWLSPPPSPPLLQGVDLTVGGEGEEKRRKKKKGRRKRAESQGVSEEDGGFGEGVRAEMVGLGLGGKNGGGKASSPYPYPFSSFASATQRKIKLQYDRLVSSNQAKVLTMDQVGQFVNCLVEARNELQHKSETIKRSFKIKKALLFKADRSSFDRLCQQIYKLEAEHKRLEEDAAVYNLLQEQLKLSPAYKTMLEIDANVELNAASDQAMEISDISFEELLAQEKKDSFWQKYGKQRACSS